MDLERLVAALAPAEVVAPADTEIVDLAYDARAVVPGAVFFCVPGGRHDGHEFAGEAVANGAAALVVERELPFAVPQLVVADAREAMARAAVAFFGDPTRELDVLGVTGTNGKTTTTFLLYEILAAAGRKPALLGTIETRIGDERRPAARTTAEAIDLQRAFRAMVEAGHRSCAIEATSHGAALKRLAGVRFAALVFTNLTHDHLDFHADLEDYFQAKRSLFVADETPPAAINVDDAHGRRLAAELRERGAVVTTFGLSGDADLRPREVELTPHGTAFTVDGLSVHTQLRGRFNVYNVLGAIAAARHVGVDDGAVRSGVASLPGVPGRFETVDEGQPFAVVVDYAHTPDSLENLLRAARELADGRVICVFGAGGDRDRGKRPQMGRIATELADVVIITSDNPRSEDPAAIVEDVLAGTSGEAEVDLDRASAIARATEVARPGDVVVIAGKGHEQGQEAGGVTLPFDDREAARAALRRLHATA